MPGKRARSSSPPSPPPPPPPPHPSSSLLDTSGFGPGFSHTPLAVWTEVDILEFWRECVATRGVGVAPGAAVMLELKANFVLSGAEVRRVWGVVRKAHAAHHKTVHSGARNIGVSVAEVWSHVFGTASTPAPHATWVAAVRSLQDPQRLLQRHTAAALAAPLARHIPTPSRRFAILSENRWVVVG